MYKRSASSSREGNVLFIRDDLFEKMDIWSNCGIDLSNSENLEKISKKPEHTILSNNNDVKQVFV